MKKETKKMLTNILVSSSVYTIILLIIINNAETFSKILLEISNSEISTSTAIIFVFGICLMISGLTNLAMYILYESTKSNNKSK